MPVARCGENLADKSLTRRRLADEDPNGATCSGFSFARKDMSDFSHYRERDRILRFMGFESYAAYLQSDLWIGIREDVFRVKGRVCFLCGGVASQVHHNRYERRDLEGRRLRFLNPICARCHKRIEFTGCLKNSMVIARKKFKKKRKKRNRRAAELRESNAAHHASYLAIGLDDAAARWGI